MAEGLEIASSDTWICETIKTIVQKGKAEVSLIHVIQKANAGSLRSMLEQTIDLGVKRVEFYPVQIMPGLTDVQLTPDEEHELYREIESLLPFHRLKRDRSLLTHLLKSCEPHL